MAVINLGQVSAIKISSTAPTNTKLLWYDTTIVSGVNLKYYDLSTSSWELLASASASIDDNNISTSTTWSSQKISDEIASGGSFTSDIPVILDGNKSLGAYINGDTIPSNGKTPQEVITLLAQEVLAPQISLTTTSSVREVGGSNAVTLNWSVTKRTNSITSIIVNGTSITPTGNSQSGTESATTTTTYGVRTFNASTSDGTNVVNASTTVRYAWRIFAGNVASKPTTSAAVRGLSVTRFDSDANIFTFTTGTTNTFFCIALPSTKNLVSVIDQTNLNLNITTQFDSESIQVEDAAGTNRTYTLWTMTTAIPYTNSATFQVTLA